jgi:hypothetical protein
MTTAEFLKELWKARHARLSGQDVYNPTTKRETNKHSPASWHLVDLKETNNRQAMNSSLAMHERVDALDTRLAEIKTAPRRG